MKRRSLVNSTRDISPKIAYLQKAAAADRGKTGKGKSCESNKEYLMFITSVKGVLY